MRDRKQLKGLGEAKGRYLPNGLIVDILSRLPSESLAKLRLVSKEWNSIVSDRKFITLQLKPRESLLGFFFQGRYQWTDGDVKSVSYIPIERELTKVEKNVLNFLPENVVVLSSSNGLVCSRSLLPCSDSEPVIYISNPLNREWRSLEWPNPSKENNTVLIFDPFKNQTDVSVSTDFHVVTVSQTDTDEEEQDAFQFSFNIYSSRTKAWAKSLEVCTYSDDLLKKRGVFVNGIVYWLTNGDHFLTFDLENELSFLVSKPFPESELECTPTMCIGEVEGKLQYVLISECGFQVWELLDRFASQWTIKHSVSLEDLERENPSCMYQLSKKLSSQFNPNSFPFIDPLCFEDTTLLLRISTGVYAFDFVSRKAKLLCSLTALGQHCSFAPIVIPYAMSLVRLS